MTALLADTDFEPAEPARHLRGHVDGRDCVHAIAVEDRAPLCGIGVAGWSPARVVLTTARVTCGRCLALPEVMAEADDWPLQLQLALDLA